jgi:hypothetical protein
MQSHECFEMLLASFLLLLSQSCSNSKLEVTVKPGNDNIFGDRPKGRAGGVIVIDKNNRFCVASESCPTVKI